jgi:hypothetical protein
VAPGLFQVSGVIGQNGFLLHDLDHDNLPDLIHGAANNLVAVRLQTR